MKGTQYINLGIELDNHLVLDSKQAKELTDKLAKIIDDCLIGTDECLDCNIVGEIKAGEYDCISIEVEYTLAVNSRDTVEYDEHGFRCTNETEIDYIDGYDVNIDKFEKLLSEIPECKCDVDGYGLEIGKVHYD